MARREEVLTARFFAWEFRPRLTLDYDVARQRFERVSFELNGDVQRVFSDAGEDEEIKLLVNEPALDKLQALRDWLPSSSALPTAAA